MSVSSQDKNKLQLPWFLESFQAVRKITKKLAFQSVVFLKVNILTKYILSTSLS